MTDEQFMRFSERNQAFKMERAANGDLLIMSPTGSEGSVKNMEISAELYLWNREVGDGTVLESSGGVILRDGSLRSPDAAWISKAKWTALSPGQREGYAPVCPEFIIELLSPSENRTDAHEKMQMWIRNGAELAWLIDPYQRAVTVYRPNREPERLDTISQVAGEGPVAGFVLPLDRIFS